MKKSLFALAVMAFLFTVNSAAQTMKSGESTPVDFQQYTSYFEKNNSGLKGQKSYLAVTDQKQFDRIFHPATTMGTNSFIPEDVFKSKIIVSTIKRDNLREYSDVKVTEKNGILWVSYNVRDQKPDGATYRSPLILGVDKGKYKEVVFRENSKRAGMARVGRTA